MRQVQRARHEDHIIQESSHASQSRHSVNTHETHDTPEAGSIRAPTGAPGLTRLRDPERAPAYRRAEFSTVLLCEQPHRAPSCPSSALALPQVWMGQSACAGSRGTLVVAGLMTGVVRAPAFGQIVGLCREARMGKLRRFRTALRASAGQPLPVEHARQGRQDPRALQASRDEPVCRCPRGDVPGREDRCLG